MARPVSFVDQTFADYGSGKAPNGETSTVRYPVTTIIAGNYTTMQTAIAALCTAAAALQVGTEVKRTTIAAAVIQGSGPASSALAQRENKWLLRYHDATNNVKYQMEIPCADLTLLAPNSEMINTTLTAWTDFKTAFEAIVKSPDDDNAVVLDSAQFVGRNL